MVLLRRYHRNSEIADDLLRSHCSCYLGDVLAVNIALRGKSLRMHVRAVRPAVSSKLIQKSAIVAWISRPTSVHIRAIHQVEPLWSTPRITRRAKQPSPQQYLSFFVMHLKEIHVNHPHMELKTNIAFATHHQQVLFGDEI